MAELRTLLVTSRVTFVPENYNRLVCGLARSHHIVGCIVIDNRHWKIVLQGLALWVSRAAPLLGWQLLKNLFNDSLDAKRSAYTEKDKFFYVVKDLNSEEARDLIHRENIDLILNARTRTYFRKSLLAIPRLGCINIHHGLLPDQRGLMCDFWGHAEDTPVGFSIHQMTSKLDDGEILKVVEIPSPKKDYMETILQGSELEVLASEDVLTAIAKTGTVSGTQNIKTPKTVYRTNPRISDFSKLRRKGVRI